jgi:hypothetical protein
VAARAFDLLSLSRGFRRQSTFPGGLAEAERAPRQREARAISQALSCSSSDEKEKLLTKHVEQKFANLPLIPCVIYVRTALNDGSGFDEQSSRCMAFAAGHGLSVRALYSDTAESGMGINLGLQRMLEDARAGRLDCLVVERADRLSRSLPIGLSILSELEASGVKVRMSSENLGSNRSRERGMPNESRISTGRKSPLFAGSKPGRRPAKSRSWTIQTFPPDTNANSEG